jgi:putative ABC transport system permease protein
MVQDLRYAVRGLLKAPGFTIVALVALALGIGANTAIFSFVDVLLLRPLPYPNADRLYATVSIHRTRGIDRGSVSYADYEDWRRDTEIFDRVAVLQPGSATITGGNGDPERLSALTVSEDFFSLVEARLLAGRGLGAADSAPGAPAATVVGYGLWLSRFGGDPGTVGRVIRIGGVPHTIVGVLGPRATYPEETQLFLPLVPSRFATEDLQRRDNLIFQGMARLAPGAARDQADARLRAIAARLEQDLPASRAGWTNGLVPLREFIVEPELTTALYVLLGAVAAVLLIACANLANLTLVRGAGRSREIGVRLALGASRRRLVRQLVTESTLLGIAGGISGIALALAGLPALTALVPPGAPFVDHVTLDLRVLLASALLTALTVVIVGVLPALSTSAVAAHSVLKDGGRGTSQGRKASLLRSALVVAEVAIAIVLLVAAGVLLRSLHRASTVSPGADISRVLAARIGVPGSRYSPPQRTVLFRDLLTRLAAEPGVQAAAIASYLPAGGGGFDLGRVFLSEGQPEPPAGHDVPAMWIVVSPDYFRTLGIPLVSGRPFADRDRQNATPVMIVSESFAARMFPQQSALGRRVRSWRDENVYREIVGVVGDVPFSSLTDRGRAMVYVPHAQQGWGGMTIALRAAAGSPEMLTPALRRTVRALDSELALSDIGTMELFARNSIGRERLSAVLVGLLAGLALVLAVVGVYGVMSYSVSLRREEMGVRLALGAAPRDLHRVVLVRGLALTAVGLIAGLAGALWTNQALESLLYQTSAFDPLSFSAMTLLLLATAFVACWLPARRAAAADPLTTLRSE